MLIIRQLGRHVQPRLKTYINPTLHMSKDTQFLTTSAAYVPEPPDPAASTPYHPGSAALIEDYTVTRWAADLREYDLRNPGVLPFAGYYILSARYTHNIIRYSLVLPNDVTSGDQLINHIYIVWELDN